MAKPVIDKSKCTGCGTCVQVCPMEVFKLEKGKSKAVKPDECIGCGACEAQCPQEAIKVE
ncbi:MAG: 4Fe-4S binding protein [Candidatus Woesearchaeota archaeon]